ncbi:uncharacterized protein LOC129976276 isoform X2 [Argiope bruennichi]|uniref:Uncharacterized protein n=1 Tax=Argiope bruennichi TaxID=94029 RepID=A0A8T0ETX2_ARGBR|nr:uncharacterized protein LOC129976276 isoform X2 [Argiope bruennichi]KAF8778704.1 hypothetical protein HNY73_015401 [Argiope bruennichi]
MLGIHTQWIRRVLGCPSGRQRRNSLADIRSRDNVDIGEYDVIDHEDTTGSDLEETVEFNTSPNSSPSVSLCMCSPNKSLPICIPRKMKPKKDDYEAFRTSSMRSTLEAEDDYHHRKPGKLMRSVSEDDISMSTISSSSDPSIMFSMSPVK